MGVPTQLDLMLKFQPDRYPGYKKLLAEVLAALRHWAEGEFREECARVDLSSYSLDTAHAVSWELRRVGWRVYISRDGDGSPEVLRIYASALW